MTIEEEIFKKTKLNIDKLLKYGFRREQDVYKYSQNIINDTFKVEVEINRDGLVIGKIYDLRIGEEYTGFRIKDISGSFIGQVRDEFQKILEDIKNKCFENEFFLYAQSNRITRKIKEKYNDNPEFQWTKFPDYAIFRNSISRKWYGLIMNIDRKKIDNSSKGQVEIINVKLDPVKVKILLKKKGFYPAYHMNKKSWITITLDDTIGDEDIMKLVAESYSYTIIQK